MSITMKIVSLIDKLKLNQYFIQKDNRAYFSPIRIRINTSNIEDMVDNLIKVDGKPYELNQLEKDVLSELEK